MSKQELTERLELEIREKVNKLKSIYLLPTFQEWANGYANSRTYPTQHCKKVGMEVYQDKGGEESTRKACAWVIQAVLDLKDKYYLDSQKSIYQIDYCLNPHPSFQDMLKKEGLEIGGKSPAGTSIGFTEDCYYALGTERNRFIVMPLLIVGVPLLLFMLVLLFLNPCF